MENNSTLSQIFVKGLPFNTSERDIRVRFEAFGSIKNIILKKGYCFIDYFNEKHAKDAISAMDNKIFDGMTISVKPSMDKKNRSGGNFQNYNDRPQMMNKDRKGPQPDDRCHNCKGVGHWANECRNEKQLR